MSETPAIFRAVVGLILSSPAKRDPDEDRVLYPGEQVEFVRAWRVGDVLGATFRLALDVAKRIGVPFIEAAFSYFEPVNDEARAVLVESSLHLPGDFRSLHVYPAATSSAGWEV